MEIAKSTVFNDAKVAQGLFFLLIAVNGSKRLVVDSAFSLEREDGKETNPLTQRVLTMMEKSDLEEFQGEKCRQRLDLNRRISSIRQAAEWGMGALQGLFSRLKLSLDVSPNKRRRVIQFVLNDDPVQVLCFEVR